MKIIERRLNNLERKKEATDNRITGIDIVIIDSREQVTNPERFTRVLDSEQTFSTGVKRRIYNLERI